MTNAMPFDFQAMLQEAADVSTDPALVAGRFTRNTLVEAQRRLRELYNRPSRGAAVMLLPPDMTVQQLALSLGVPRELAATIEPEAFQHRISMGTQIRTINSEAELRASIANGYPIQIGNPWEPSAVSTRVSGATALRILDEHPEIPMSTGFSAPPLGVQDEMAGITPEQLQAIVGQFPVQALPPVMSTPHDGEAVQRPILRGQFAEAQENHPMRDRGVNLEDDMRGSMLQMGVLADEELQPDEEQPGIWSELVHEAGAYEEYMRNTAPEVGDIWGNIDQSESWVRITHRTASGGVEYVGFANEWPTQSAEDEWQAHCFERYWALLYRPESGDGRACLVERERRRSAPPEEQPVFTATAPGGMPMSRVLQLRRPEFVDVPPPPPILPGEYLSGPGTNSTAD